MTAGNDTPLSAVPRHSAYAAGHKPTDYKQWFHATAPYPIQYQHGYEPYLLTDRRLMPLYDERFRGYGTVSGVSCQRMSHTAQHAARCHVPQNEG
jgi:Glycosyl-transferase for dystroglycan